MRLRVGRPLWLSHAPTHRRRQYPTLRRAIATDVVIVGGGLTGAAVVQVFAEAGVDVVLVEAGLVGHGSTAASTALILKETDEELAALRKRYGPTAAKRIWELSRQATRDLVTTVRRLDISCDLAERDAVYYTTNPKDVASLRAECQLRRRSGFDAVWLSPAALLAATGIRGEGAIRSSGNAALDPYRACVGLLRSAARRGARIFERSEVRRIEPSPTGVAVTTRDGMITARRVIIATGYATPAFAPLAGRFRMRHTYVLGTAPIDDRQRARLGLRDLLLWDTARPYHYVRWTRDRRLLLGGNDRPLVPSARRRQAFVSGAAHLREYFEGVFPALEEIEIEYAWEGLFAATPDGLPFIGSHRRYPRHLFALGYGGNGMTFSFLAARLLLDAVRNVQDADQRLFAFNRLRHPAR
jgi:glycine/D-amino acid oxidase-like deaminating enzyme